MKHTPLLLISFTLFVSAAHAEPRQLSFSNNFTSFDVHDTGSWVCRCDCNAHLGNTLDIPGGKCDGTEEGEECTTSDGDGNQYDGELENCRNALVQDN